MKEPIKIALVCTSLNVLGGANNHLKNIYKFLSEKGFRVSIFYSSKVSQELKDFMVGKGVNANDLIPISRLKKWLVLPFILSLRDGFLKKRIDIVHTFNMQSDVLGGMAARAAGIKCLCSFFESKVFEDNIFLPKQMFYKIANDFIRKWFVKNVVVSQGLKKELISESIRPKDTIAVIRLGFKIPEKYLNYGFSSAKLTTEPLIGAISRLDKEKGLDRFILTMPLILKKIPGAKFILVGRGGEEESLRILAMKLGVSSKIIFKEWTNDIFSILETIDVFVMPSLREGCPNALLEAMALCRPVVASKIDGITDIIEDEKSGLLVDTANIDKFAEKIVYLCGNSDRAAVIGNNGQLRVRTEFTIEREARELSSLYEDIFKSR